MKIMAIDYGDAHTGIAISDYTETLAGHSEVIHSRKQEEVLAAIRRIVAEHGVKLLVLGYPRNMDGTVGVRAEKCAAFAEVLRQETGLEVVLWDERRTTIDAHNILQRNCYALIPTTVADEDAASAVLEALSSESYRTLVPEYCEVSLKVRYSQYDDVSRMFDLIINSIVYDPGEIYANLLETPSGMVKTAITNNDPNWASRIAAQKEQLIAKMEKVTK